MRRTFTVGPYTLSANVLGGGGALPPHNPPLSGALPPHNPPLSGALVGGASSQRTSVNSNGAVFLLTANVPRSIAVISSGSFLAKYREIHVVEGRSMLDQLMDTGCAGDDLCEKMVIADAINAYILTAGLNPCEVWVNPPYHGIKSIPSLITVKLTNL